METNTNDQKKLGHSFASNSFSVINFYFGYDLWTLLITRELFIDTVLNN